MKFWGAGSVPVAKVDNGPEVVDKALRRKAATQRLKDEILNRNVGRDSRNDVDRTPKQPADSSTKKRKTKKQNKISIGRNTSNDAQRDPPATPAHGSNTLSRLLFSKQNMELRDQWKVVYRQFGPDAQAVLNVEKEDLMPSPEKADHVIIKVQVRKDAPIFRRRIYC